MKFVMERTAALTALTRVSGVIPKKANAPILGHVAIEAFADGKVTFRGTNLDMQSSAHATATVVEDGDVTAEADKLLSIVRNAAEGSDIAFEALSGPPRLNVKSGRSRFNLPTLPMADFPEFGGDEWPTTFDISAATLADMLERTRFSAAAAKDASKAFLAGVRLAVNGGELHAVATESHKFSIIRTDAPEGSADMAAVTLPHAMVDEILSVLAGEKANVRMMLSPTKAAVFTDTSAIVGKIMGLNFIDYMNTLARFAPGDNVVTAGREALMGAVRRVASVGDAANRSVRFSIEPDGVIGLFTQSQSGDGEDEVQGELSGVECKSRFNADWLMEILDHLQGDKVDIKYKNSEHPFTFVSPDDADATFILCVQRL